MNNSLHFPAVALCFHLSGGWLTCSQNQPDLNGTPPADLLALALKTLGGNCRYAPGPAGVTLVGEVATATTGAAIAEAQDQLQRWLALPGKGDCDRPTADHVESALAGWHEKWQRRESAWAVAAPKAGLGEIVVEVCNGGLSCSLVVSQEEDPLQADVRTALATLLYCCHAGLRLVRCQLTDRQALVRSFVPGNEELEEGLHHSLTAVTSAARRLTPSARALLDPALAQRYVAMASRSAPAA